MNVYQMANDPLHQILTFHNMKMPQPLTGHIMSGRDTLCPFCEDELIESKLEFRIQIKKGLLQDISSVNCYCCGRSGEIEDQKELNLKEILQ